jgi:hypothetical protein
VSVQDLPKGTPFRHVRARAGLLLEGADPQVMNTALAILINKHPDSALAALADAVEMHERWESS